MIAPTDAVISVPDSFWVRREVQDSLSARDVGRLVKLFMNYSGLSQTRIGARTGLEQGSVSNLVNGKRAVISIDLLERLAVGLGMPDEGRILMGLAPVRRTSRTAFLVSEREIFDATADRAATFGAWAESSNVGPEGIEEIHQTVSYLATDYLSESPVEVVQRATNLAGRIFELLQGHQWPAQTRELYLAAGRVNILLAWISGDLGYPRTAETHGKTAWLCANMADSDELRAWSLSVQSKTSFWAGDYVEAAALAKRGRKYAHNLGTAPVLLACQEADAWAEAGAHEYAAHALGSATAAHEDVKTTDSVGGLLSCDSTRFQNYAGAVLLRIGRSAEAVEMASEVLESSSVVTGRLGYGTVAQVRIWAARAHIQSGEVDGAVEVLTPVLSLPGGKRLETVASRLRQVRAELSTRPELIRSKAAGELVSTIGEY
ncbi:helix-turn-helix domain-containing protein [Cryptosporangium sp. NPDC051539]|uniref:helix-turn-helix domain-containing protein n=1 Tax=Cryptosporangium sp. NPDC051539 TaxID=3363962 RepID=UPI0037A579E9